MSTFDPNPTATAAEESWDDLGARLARAVAALRELADESETERDRLTAKAQAMETIHGYWQTIGFRTDASSFVLLWDQVTSLAEHFDAPVRDACAVALDYLRSY